MNLYLWDFTILLQCTHTHAAHPATSSVSAPSHPIQQPLNTHTIIATRYPHSRRLPTVVFSLGCSCEILLRQQNCHSHCYCRFHRSCGTDDPDRVDCDSAGILRRLSSRARGARYSRGISLLIEYLIVLGIFISAILKMVRGF